MDFYRDKGGKRLFDMVLIIVAFPVWLPPVIVIYLLNLAIIGRPVFFVQERAGRNGKVFRIVKFRSMKLRAQTDGQDAQRITRFGVFLRRWSLDELPEFWNIIRGEMSFVGPRPLLPEYTKRYTPRQRARLEVKPGLTGLAQVSGRNSLSWEETFKIDAEYVESINFCNDLKILFHSIFVVASGRGSGSREGKLRGEFKG